MKKNHSLLFFSFIILLSCKQENPKQCVMPSTQSINYGVEYLGNLDSAIQYSKCVNRPLVVFFTQLQAVSCRKMEAIILPSFWIKRKLNSEFVVVKVYVDDKAPISDTFYSEILDKTVETLGDKYFHYQLAEFKSASGPFFAILDTNQKSLVEFAYTPKKKDVIKFLDEALLLFEKGQSKQK